jgi:hypothetical protein
VPGSPADCPVALRPEPSAAVVRPAGCGVRSLPASAAGAIVCSANEGGGLIPATFEVRGVLMSSGFHWRSFFSNASQTPMSCCSASNASTSTRTGDRMSSIVLVRAMVSRRHLSLGGDKPSVPQVGAKSPLLAPIRGRLGSFGSGPGADPGPLLGTDGMSAGWWGPVGTRRNPTEGLCVSTGSSRAPRSASSEQVQGTRHHGQHGAQAPCARHPPPGSTLDPRHDALLCTPQ